MDIDRHGEVITSTMNLHAPQVDYVGKLEGNFTSFREGYLKISQVISEKHGSVVVSYKVDDSKLKCNYIQDSNGSISAHKIIICGRSDELCIVYDNHALWYQSKLAYTSLQRSFKIDMPYFDIQAIANMTMLNSNFTVNLHGFFQKNSVDTIIQGESTEFDATTNYTFGNYSHGSMTTNFRQTPDELLFKNVVVQKQASDLLERLNTYIHVNKTHRILAKIQNTLELDFMYSPEIVTNLTFLERNHMFFNIKNDTFRAYFSSAFLSESDIEVIFKWLVQNYTKQLNFIYLQNRAPSVSGSIQLNHDSETFILTTEAFMNNQNVFHFSTNIVNKNVTEGKIILKTQAQTTQAYFIISLFEPFTIGFTINCPLVTYNGYTFETGVSKKSSSFFVFFGSGYSEALANGFLELKFHKQYIFVETSIEKNTFHAKFEAEKVFWVNVIELTVEANMQKDAIKLLENFAIRSNETDYLFINSNFELRDNFEVGIHTKLPMLKLLEIIDFDLFIPLHLTYNFRPSILIGRNGQNYFAKFAYLCLDHEFLVQASYEFKQSKANVIIHLDSTSLFSQFDLPLGIVEVALKTPKDLQTGEKVYNYLNIFGSVLKLNYCVIYKPFRKLLDFSLETPFKYYKKFVINLEYENTSKKVFKVLVFHPIMQKEVGVDLVFTYHGIHNFNTSAILSLPYKIHGFKYGKIGLGHNMDMNKETKKFSIIAHTQFNDFKAVLDFITLLNINTILIKLDLHKNNQNIFFRFNSVSTKLKNDIVFEFESPLTVANAFQFLVSYSPRFNDGFQTFLTYNFKTYWDVTFEPNSNLFSLYINNVFKQFLVEYKYSYTSYLETYGKFSWGSKNPNVDRAGFNLVYGQNASFVLTLPTREVGVFSNHFVNSNVKYYYYEVSWYKDKRVSVKLSNVSLSQNNKQFIISSAELAFPFRTFAITDEVEVSLIEPSNFKSSLIFKWAENEFSRISLENHYFKEKLESRLSIPTLMHDIVLKVDATAALKIPSCITAKVEYSDDIDKKLEVTMHYNKEITKHIHTERRFVLKHPSSKIDYDLRFSTTTTQKATIGNITLFYYNYLLQQQESIKSALSINHEKFDIIGEIETSKNFLSLSSITQVGFNYKGLSITMQINNKEPLILSGVYMFKPNEPSMHLSASIGSSRAYNFYAGFPSKREVTAKLAHSIYDIETVDSLLTLRLNNSQILWMKLNWRNQLFPQFKSFILDEYYDLRYAVEAIGQELIDTIDDSIGQQFLDDLMKIKCNLSNYVLNETSSLQKVYQEFLVDIKDGYQTNLFYIQDVMATTQTLLPKWKEFKIGLIDPIAYFVDSLLSLVVTIMTDAVSSIYNTCESIKKYKNLTFTIEDIKNIKLRAKEILRNGINDAREALKEMDVLVMQLLEKMDECVIIVQQHFENAMEPYITIMDDFINYLEQRLTILQILLLDVLDTVQFYIINLRESREIFQGYLLYVNWLEEVQITTLMEPVADIVESLLESIVTDTSKVLQDYRPYFNALAEGIFGNYKEINELPPIVEFKEMCNHYYERTLWIWNYHNFSKIFKSYIHQIISNFDDYFASLIELEEKGNDFENVLEQSNYVFRPDLGVIEVTQLLPVEWDAFDELPHFEQESLYQKVKRRSEHLLQLQRTYFIDLLANFNSYIGKPSTSLSPSTNNIASIVGKSHYITFDKKYYNFSGQCSYLLASDLVENSFSVIVNYTLDNSSVIRKSVSVLHHGNNFEISPEFGVKLNDYQIRLPLLNENLTIVQENYLISIDIAKRLKIACNLYYDFCTVELSGWLFGKTGGLLGTLDNEKNTDMSLPGGDHTSDIVEFAQGWQLQTCPAVNNAENLLKINSPFATMLFKTLCQVYFVNSNSPLGNCFNLVDPTPFYNMCVNSMKSISNPTICASIATYKAHCDTTGVSIKIPDICISCNHGIGQNEDVFNNNNPKSIDIVIIKDACFSDNHNVSQFIQNLDKHLISRHFINNQFAVVGFGYDVGKPFVYTDGKKIWTESTGTISTLNVKPKYQASQNFLVNNAIKFATNLEFRPAISKIFVLMLCDSQQEQVNLNSLHKSFGDKDIIFHVLKTQVTGNNGDELIEMDKKGNILFINHGFDTKSLKITASIKPAEDVTDPLIVLSLSTNGSALRVDKSSESKVDEFAIHWSEIVSQSARHSPCQRCKCVANTDGTGKVECSRCMSPAVKQLLTEYEASLMEFKTNDDNT